VTKAEELAEGAMLLDRPPQPPPINVKMVKPGDTSQMNIKMGRKE
jgi:hypothetical protein